MVHIDERLLALDGVGIRGLKLQILGVIHIGLVELLLETAHLGEVEIELALELVVFLVGQTLVDAFGAGIVVGQSVALANLEIDAVLLSLVVLDFLVGSLVFLHSLDEAVLVEEFVGFCGQTFLSARSHACYQGKKEQ